MPKSFEDVKKALEADKELLEALDSHIESQRKESSTAANKEAKGLRERKKVLEATLSKLGTLLDLDFTGEDVEDKIAEVETKVKKTTKEGNQGAMDPETKRLITSLQKQLDEQAKAYKDLQFEAETNLKHSKLTELLTKANVDPVMVSDIVELLGGKVTVAEGKKLRAKKGEEEITVEDFVSDYVKTRPGIVKNPQQPGAGAQKQGGQQGGPEKSPDTSNMSPSKKLELAFTKK